MLLTSIALPVFDKFTSVSPPTSVKILCAILLNVITSAFITLFCSSVSSNLFSVENENCSGTTRYIFCAVLLFICSLILFKQNWLFPVPALP